jgi:hypothetical protein
MRSESTRFFGQPRLTKPTLGCDISKTPCRKWANILNQSLAAHQCFYQGCGLLWLQFTKSYQVALSFNGESFSVA